MFKLSFLKMRTESALKKNKSLRASIPYKQAQSMGIIFSVEDKQKHSDIKEFIRLLEQDGKKVHVLEYLPLKKENYEFMFDFFSVQDLNFWGNLKSDKAIQFSETPFDYLFCIDKESNPLVLNLLARSKARCRVGRFHETESPYFEMMIEQNGTTKGLIETMYKYTKQLR
jgi:hypothetical protein